MEMTTFAPIDDATTTRGPLPIPIPIPLPIPAPIPFPIVIPLGHHGEKDHHDGAGGVLSDDYDEWSDEAVMEAMLDTLHAMFPKPLLALLLSEVEEHRDIGGLSDDSSSSEDDDDDWLDWDGLLGKRRRRDAEDEVEDEDDEDHEDLARLILAGKRKADAAAAKSVDDDGNALGQDVDEAGNAAFLETLRRVFRRARSRMLGRNAGAAGVLHGVLADRQRARAALAGVAARAMNVTSAEASRAFEGMATRWVGEALFDLLFEEEDQGFEDQDEDEDDNLRKLRLDAKVNGGSNQPAAEVPPADKPQAPSPATPSTGSWRSGRQLDLSPSSVAYFLVEVLGTMAGLGWGALFVGSHAG